MTTTNHRWPASLYAPTEAERGHFGGRWVYAGELLPHGAEVLVAQYPEPDPLYWVGRGVDVYCEAAMAARYYRLDVLPGTMGDNAGKPGYTIWLSNSAPAGLAAMIAQAIWYGNMTAAGNA